MSFFAPVWNQDGTPTGPQSFKNLVRERYLISKHTHTSYADTGNISIKEKDQLLQFIMDDIQKQNEAVLRRVQEQNSGRQRIRK